MNKKIFSEKTQTRMDTLKQRLTSYEESIYRLHQFAEDQLTKKIKSNTFGTAEYKSILLKEQFTLFQFFGIYTYASFR